jgi:hypothetical protein
MNSLPQSAKKDGTGVQHLSPFGGTVSHSKEEMERVKELLHQIEQWADAGEGDMNIIDCVRHVRKTLRLT